MAYGRNKETGAAGLIRASSTDQRIAGGSKALRQGDDARVYEYDAGGFVERLTAVEELSAARSGDAHRLRAGVPDGAVYLGACDGLDLYSVASLDAVTEIWREFQQSAWHTPFQDIDWIGAWLASKPEDARPRAFVVMAYSGDRLRMILPMAETSRFGVHVLRWAADNSNDFNAPVIDPEFVPFLTPDTVERIWALLAKSDNAVDAICLKRQPDRIAGHANPFITRHSTSSSCSSHSLSLHSGWTELYATLRSAKSRRRLREKFKKLRKSGSLTFRSVREPVARQLFIDQILSWKSRQLQGAGERDPFGDSSSGSGVRSTILDFARRDGEASKLRIYGLFIDGKPLAGLIGFTAGDTFSMLTMAYAPDSDRSTSPGLCLLLKTLELTARSNLKTYDFLAGDEPYKFEWCDIHTGLFDNFLGMTASGLFLAMTLRVRLAVKKAIKSNPYLFGRLKAANAWRIRARQRFEGSAASQPSERPESERHGRPV